MTSGQKPRPGGRSERGAALITTVLLLLVLTGVATALAVSGRTEFRISENHEAAAQAQAAAEAGLNHALEATLANLRNWQANGFANPSAAMSRLLRGPDNQTGTALTDADNGSLEGLGIPRPPALLTLVVGSFYEARLFDEDDPARGLTLANADVVRIGENAQVAADANTRLIVRAIGYAGGGTMVTLEATIGPIAVPAVVTNGSLTISGNATIAGTAGGVHSNLNLTVSGNPTITQNATASGTYSVSGNPVIGGQAGGSRPSMVIPPVRAIDYRPNADFVLTSTGQMTTLAGVVVCDASVVNQACQALGYGWVFQGANGWKISGNSASGGTYYVEGPATISGNPGSPGAPVPLTIIAEGSIDIGGNPDLTTDTPGLLFVTDGDLSISGGLSQPLMLEGAILVHEQLKISGNPTLAGQFLVEDAINVSTLVDQNTISGNPSITYNGTLAGTSVAVIAWREVR